MPQPTTQTASRSPSKRLPRLAALLVLAAACALVLSALYTTRINPEIRHFLGTHAIKQDWAAKMTREHGPKVVVYGGSSCEFSIDGERLLQRYRLPCANLGRGAGMGAVVLTMAALDHVREGDTLVVALEPALLTDEPELPNLGVQFSLASGNAHWILHPLPPTQPMCPLTAALALRPGGQHVFAMLGKLLSGQPLYRYHLEDMHPSGFNETALRLDVQGPPGHGGTVPPASLAFLQSLREWCQQHRVRFVYSLPWGYTPAEVLASTRRDNAAFLLQIIDILPVLKDPMLGAHEVREDFADTAWHLTPAAAAQRTDALAGQLQHWEVWTPEELRALVSGGI